MNNKNLQDKKLPGTVGNPFDLFLRLTEKIQHWPVFFIFIILCGLAYTSAWGKPLFFIIMLIFFISDWILLASLSKFKISFGPAKPPVLMLAVMRAVIAVTSFPISTAFGIILQCIGVVLVVYAFWIEPRNLQITHQTLSLDRFDHPLKIVHLGDLHIERRTQREEKVLKALKEFKPDLILFSGDFLNLSYLHEKTAHYEARTFIAELKAKYGVYAVSGSPAVDLPEILPDLLKDLQLQRLDNEIKSITHGDQTVEIIGITCTHDPIQDGKTLKQLSTDLSGNFTILLYHTPDLTPQAADIPINLQLSGHTHGGQVRIPFYGAIFTGALTGKQYEAGLYQEKALSLYVTRGIGLEGAGAPRVRFLCPPEIIFWEIN